jgi:hypothetical protein
MTDPVVFPASRRKGLLLLLGSVVFVALGWWMTPEHPLAGWFCMVFFGLGVPVSMAMLRKGSTYLKLDADGFEIGSPFNKWRIRWEDVEGFELAAVHRAKMIAIVYRKEYKAQRLLRRTAGTITGIEGGIADNYAAPLDEVLQALRAWHARRLRDA